jgi:hypothetical protein
MVSKSVLHPIVMADELLRYRATRQRNSREVLEERSMRCAACRPLLGKFKLCDQIRCECGWKWYLQWRNGLSFTYLSGSEGRRDNGLRQSSAGRSFRFRSRTKVPIRLIPITLISIKLIFITIGSCAWCMRPRNPIGRPIRNCAHRRPAVHTSIGRSEA